MFNLKLKSWGVFICLLLFVGLAGCPKKTETASQSIEVPPTPSTPSTPPPVEEVRPSQPSNVIEEPLKSVAREIPGLKDAFFDFDKASITSDGKAALEGDADWLKANPTVKIKIEGHCDERGTNEYNLALGEKRAHSAKLFLTAQGVSSARISTISYGEDRPFCTEHNENCYAQHRRPHFVIAK